MGKHELLKAGPTPHRGPMFAGINCGLEKKGLNEVMSEDVYFFMRDAGYMHLRGTKPR